MHLAALKSGTEAAEAAIAVAVAAAVTADVAAAQTAALAVAEAAAVAANEVDRCIRRMAPTLTTTLVPNTRSVRSSQNAGHRTDFG